MFQFFSMATHGRYVHSLFPPEHNQPWSMGKRKHRERGTNFLWRWQRYHDDLYKVIIFPNNILSISNWFGISQIVLDARSFFAKRKWKWLSRLECSINCLIIIQISTLTCMHTYIIHVQYIVKTKSSWL